MQTHAEALRALIQGDIDDRTATREKYSRDASLFKVTPELIAYPRDAHDIEAMTTYALNHSAAGDHVSLTARAAGTDMSGGPLNTSVIVDSTRYMNQLLELGNGEAIVQPGMYFRDFDAETRAHGWELPSYTASRDLCAVGGMVGNNAGGEKNLKYGKTDRYVKELDIVLGDGATHTFRRIEGIELQKKLRERSYEGNIYRAVAKLVASNKALIHESRPRVTKNSSGYAVWDIGSKEEGWMDLSRLMVGAQGTLGIITKIRFDLVRPKPHAALAVLMLDDLSELGPIITSVLSYEPDSFESYDDHTFHLAIKYFPELAARMKAGIIRLAFSLIPEALMVATGGVPKLVLLAEFRDESQARATAKAQEVAQRIHASHKKVRIRIADDVHEMQKYWTIRRESFNLLRSKVRGKRTAPFIDDFVVPPQTLPDFLPKLEALLTTYNLVYTIAGHVGDGNFHIIPLMNPSDPKAPHIIDELSHAVYDLVIATGGSISGEHNDGLIRTPYVEKMFGQEMYRLFEEVKRIFDPLNVFNPGKKVGTTFTEAMQFFDFNAVETSHNHV